MAAAIPGDEARRLADLHALDLLDTPSEARFDRLAELASALLDTPIALLSLVDEQRQWFKAKVGIDAAETSRDLAFCAHAILDDDGEPFVVEDTLLDDRFATNPLVTGEPAIRFYAGQVVHGPDGLPVGTLCAIDRRPRQFDASERRILSHLAALVEQEFERDELVDLAAGLVASERSKRLVLETLSEGLVLQDRNGKIVEWNAAAERVLGMTGDQLAGRTSMDERWQATYEDGTPWPGETHPAVETLRTGKEISGVLMGVRRADDSRVWLRVSSSPVLDDAGEVDGVLAVFADVTAETLSDLRAKELEQQLRLNEATSRVSLDSLDYGVVLMDRTGLVVRSNPSAERVLGYSDAALTDLWRSPDWETYDEDGAVLPRGERPIQKAIDSGEPVLNQSVGWRRPDGEHIVIRTSVVPTGVGTDEFVVSFADITDQHRSQRLLDATFDTAPVGLAVVDADGLVTRCNATFGLHAGRNADELLGTDVAALVGDEAEALAPSEHRITRPDGSAAWLSARLAPIPGPQNLSIAATVDVTAERTAVAQFHSAFDDAPIGMALVDDHFGIIEVNTAFESIAGYAADVLVGMRLSSLCHPDDMADADGAWSDLFESGAPFQTEQRLVKPDGSVIWASIHTSVVGDRSVGSPRAITQVMDITEQHRYQTELAHMAAHDPLTGLVNRRAFEASLGAHITMCQRYGPQGALLMLDLDNFKRINDTLGHSVGDQLIISTARVLQQRLRASDVICRLGGDEFAVLLPKGNAAEAELVAQEICDAVRSKVVTLKGRTVRATVSVGIADFDERQRPADEMLVNADLAMYDAKEAGRDGWARYSNERYDGPRTTTRLTWMNRIEEALEHDRFVLWAQPIVRLSDGAVTSHELLIRMLDDEGELIPPATFLYIAERFGLISRIDRWVVTSAVRMLEELQRRGTVTSVAVNLSGHSLADEALLGYIEDLVSHSSIAPERLVFEVTETAAIANLAAGREFADRLRALGCRLALDDFGAGFGSFFYLKHLPFDYVKIDGEFVHGCLDNATDQSIIRSLVRLAAELGKQTIAEHVESAEVQGFLREQGVGQAQGYHLGRPVPAGDALELV